MMSKRISWIAIFVICCCTWRASVAATTAKGYGMVTNPVLNKGTSFTTDEKDAYGLRGLVPAGGPLSLEVKLKNLMEQLRLKSSPLEKYIFLHTIQDTDETLYYSALTKHTEECMPIVYTPTVGEACQKWSQISRCTPRGLYLSIQDKGQIREILNHYPQHDIDAIVVTDGERILGLGDLGVNGMGIPIGKLALYTACAGINPAKTLPVHIDVGCNNDDIINDPIYMGLRQKRDHTRAAYDELLKEFIIACQDKYGRNVLIQFEDFGNSNAFRLLHDYKDKVCCFNDDIQGTAAVVVAGIIASSKLSGIKLTDHTYLFYGAGEAGVGIADLLVTAITKEDPSISILEARRKVWLVDRKGLITSERDMGKLEHHKHAYAHETIANAPTNLIESIRLIKPTALFGLSTQGQSFTKEVCETMVQNTKALHDGSKPLIFALSNPTSKAECTASQAYEWCEGEVVFASGSPFDPVDIITSKGEKKSFVPGQGNNAYIFPGVGLGAIVAGATSLTDEDFYVAASSLAVQVTAERLQLGCAYPPLKDIREVSAKIAGAVAANIIRNKRSVKFSSHSQDMALNVENLVSTCREFMYSPRYENVDVESRLKTQYNANSGK